MNFITILYSILFKGWVKSDAPVIAMLFILFGGAIAFNVTLWYLILR